MKRLGFTLIELLVAIAIIGVLARLATVSYSVQKRVARDASRRAALTQYGTALEQHFNQERSYMVIPTGCTVIPGSGGATYPGSTYEMPVGAMAACVGYSGGGWGSLHRRSTADLALASYPGTSSIAEALRASGYIQKISLDPRTGGNFPSTSASDFLPGNIANFDDYILTLCDTSGMPASSPEKATEYGLFAQLEGGPADDGTEGLKSKTACGGPDTTFPWNTIN